VIAITEVRLPACMGFEWRRAESDVQMQLVWIRGTTGFRFGMKAHEDGPWGFVRVTHPDYQPRTEAEAREMARAFVDAGAKEDA